jgi:endonuclease/exonuclease/phosphatase (EEP) superfamily protein YafD
MMPGARTLRLIVTVAASGLALVTLFALFARLWWAFDLFSHFRLQYLVAAACLGVVALAIRARAAAAVLAVVALVHGFAIKDLWLGGTASAALGGTPVRVVSANVWTENPTPAQALEFVRASNADLVVLVDARSRPWRRVLAELEALYPYHTQRSWTDSARGRGPRAAAVILFSRHRILAEKVVRPPKGRRPYLVAELDVGGRTLTVVGVHSLSPFPDEPGRSRRRNRELDHIAKTIRETAGPVIAAGDFNATPWSPHFRDLIAAGGLRDAIFGQGYVATWPTLFWPALIPIDHVLVKGPLAVTTLRRGPGIGSDHYPLIADLRLLSSPGATNLSARRGAEAQAAGTSLLQYVTSASSSSVKPSGVMWPR